MIQTLGKIIIRIALYTALLLIITFSWIIIYFSEDNKQIPPQIVSYIESSIESLSDNNMDIFVSYAEVKFINFEKGFNIKLKDGYIQMGKNIITSIPEMSAKIKPLDLLLLNLNIKEVYLNRPQVVITDTKSRPKSGDIKKVGFFQIYKTIIYNLFEAVDKESKIIPVEKVSINNINFSFNQSGEFQDFLLKKANLQFYTLQDSTYLKTDIETDIEQKNTKISANARLLENDRMILSFEFSKLPYEILSGLVVSRELQWLNEIKPILDGKGNVLMEKEGVTSKLYLSTGFRFDTKKFKNTNLAFNTEIDFIPDQTKDIVSPLIKAKVKLDNLTVKDLVEVWPENYASEAREGLTKNLSKGIIEDITFGGKYLFSDLTFSKRISESLNISGNIKNADIKFNERFPKIQDVSSFINYDGNNLVADIKKARFSNFEIGKSFLELENINDEVAIIKLKGSGKGEVNELKPLLHGITRKRDKEFFYNTHEISADTELEFNYTDNINNGFDPNVVKLDVKGELKNAYVAEAIKGIDFTADKLSLIVNTQGLTISGNGIANDNSPSEIKAFVGFEKKNHYEISAKSKAQASDLNNTIRTITEYINGELDLDLNFKSINNSQIFTSKVDLNNAKINFPYFSINKQVGEFAQLSLFGRLISGKAIEIAEFSLLGDNLSAQGNAIVSLDNKVADEIYVSKLFSQKNDAEIYYSSLENKKNNTTKQTIKVNGNSYDAANLISNIKSESSNKGSLNLDADIKTLHLKNNIKINNVIASVKCGVEKCYRAEFNAQIDEESVISSSFKPDRENKDFILTTNNLGRIIQGLGFNNAIYKGSAEITANSILDEKGTKYFAGNITVNDYKIMNAPVMAKILSLASITGIAELLSGSGIKMKNLDGNFELHDNYLSLQNIHSQGNSMGLTMQGTVDLEKSYVDLSGAVSPSYSINSMFGKIPFIGFLFNARKGEGLIATKFYVEGKYPRDVDVTVNPLSALTPGVLREIWGRADTKK